LFQFRVEDVMGVHSNEAKGSELLRELGNAAVKLGHSALDLPQSLTIVEDDAPIELRGIRQVRQGVLLSGPVSVPECRETG
jgi:hypothetical protein